MKKSKINKLCKKCALDCKQSEDVKVISCPAFLKKSQNGGLENRKRK